VLGYVVASSYYESRDGLGVSIVLLFVPFLVVPFVGNGMLKSVMIFNRAFVNCIEGYINYRSYSQSVHDDR